MRMVRFALVAAFFLAPATAIAGSQAPTVLVAKLEGPITPVSADHVERVIDRAVADDHSAVLVEIDTPGGLDTSMREIVRSFLNSPVPVIGWVAPPGARAASAGAVIMLSTHVAAMAEGTNIGAATPVDIQGGDLGDKIINDATAYVVAIAEQTGRNVTFARDIVQKGRSVPSSEALEIGAIDLVVNDRESLLEEIDGTKVLVEGNEATLDVAGATFVTKDLGFVNRVRQRLADPNLAFLFMSLGTLAIIYEVANPGMGLGGIAGVILLVLAMFALSVLEVNAVGVVLLVLAIGLFVAEFFVPGIGVMAAGGTISLVLSGIFLVQGDQRVDLTILLPTALVMFGASMFATRMAWRTRGTPSPMGAEGLVGKEATVTRTVGQKGQIFVEGAWWSVRADRDLQDGESVRISAIDGMELIVEARRELLDE